ncbi:TetR/AcrR family transcriptional regulator [Proteiniphilum acetatigenes]|uniref:TetR/AcrR family transcriptional regulator n=1 Tax=Proteiniphilum acetatigenes TaxID=294710 RepID=UPI000475C24B|nr:TetR/AcrR family transcriptional regulator [Proteiniphilum acetatigenes]
MHGSREHIIKKATALFLQKSFKAVTMKEIVESTGLSKGAFYHYFPSKESLFFEIVETYIRMLNIDFDKFSKNSLYEFYHNYIDSSYKKFMQLKEFLEDTNDEDDLTYITLTFDAINLFPGFKEQVRQLHNRELSAWENVIQLAMERGEIKSSMSAMQIAKLFVYVSDGIGQRLIMQGQIKDLKDELLALWNGLYNDLKV